MRNLLYKLPLKSVHTEEGWRTPYICKKGEEKIDIRQLSTFSRRRYVSEALNWWNLTLQDISEVLGIKLKVTSFIRKENVHRYGCSIDAAPADAVRIGIYKKADYTKGKSPLLFFQPLLLFALSRTVNYDVDFSGFPLEDISDDYELRLIIALEDNHFHFMIGSFERKLKYPSIITLCWTANDRYSEFTAAVYNNIINKGFVNLVSQGI